MRQPQDDLDRAVHSHVIVLDTCFAMQDSFDSFLENYRERLTHNHILVPYKVVQELETVRGKQDERLHSAQHTLDLLDAATKNGLAEFRRDAIDDKVINDSVISRVVEQMLPRRDVLVLTHDENLTNYLYTKTEQQCISMKNLLVAGVNRSGHLFLWNDGNGKAPPNVLRPRHSGRFRPQRTDGYSGPKPFLISSSLPSSLGRPLAAKQPLRTADPILLSDGTRLRLRQMLASGGEGIIYELDDQALVCKIYDPHKLTLDRQEKIELMLTRDVRDPAICWPRAAVYDSDGVFRGFTMPRAPGKPVPLGHSLFIPAAFSKTHQNWTRRESVTLAITIAKKIKYLHDMNVLVGDINPLNILMKDEKTVYFVDCDSFQVEGYPCPVGTVNFTAPEIQGSDFRHFLRTKEHEHFSVATLIFMIFMPGKQPYSHQGGEDGAANIRKMHFPYPLGDRGAKGAPEGPWRRCWSHLTLKIKQEFHRCFHEDNRDQPRTTVERWLTVLDWYAYELSKKENVFIGPSRRVGFDLAILPQNTRRIEKEGEVRPPWPNDTLSDMARTMNRLVAEASRATGTTGSYLRTTTTAIGQGSAAQATGWKPPTPTASPTGTYGPPVGAGAGGTSYKGRSADWKWIIAIVFIGAVGGVIGLIWSYWDPIIQFIEAVVHEVLTLIGYALVIAVIIGILAAKSSRK